jgi:phosphotriesterase-related protein
VVIGHAGDTTDLDYLEELIANGSYLGMDRFGIEFLSFEDRVATIAALCARGHADRLVLGHDSYCFNDRFEPEVIKERHPNYHLLHISQDALPAFRAAGVAEEQIWQMLVDNPRRILAPVQPY